MELQDVVARVRRRFDAGAGTGARWSNPHEKRDVAPEEYSRVSEPSRYRLVGARAMAWIETLSELQLARAETVTAPSWGYGPAEARAVLLTPEGHGALSILVVLGSMEGVEDAVIAIGVGTPPVLIGMQPDCGCDACDSGSHDLLTSIDQMFTAVMDGDLIYAEDEDWTLTVGVDGWSAHGSEDFGELVVRARSGASIGRRMITGAAWLP
jgi:hypothetical protein